MKKMLRDPLVHFLVFGLGLFVLFELVASDDAAYDSRVIDVDRDALLTFVQYRSRAFQPHAAAARLDGMSEEELDRLISDYVREEALHREAKALGVDKNDYIIKRRIIQSIEFITDGFVTAAVDVSDDDIAPTMIRLLRSARDNDVHWSSLTAPASYLIGAVASMWMIERVAGFWA